MPLHPFDATVTQCDIHYLKLEELSAMLREQQGTGEFTNAYLQEQISAFTTSLPTKHKKSGQIQSGGTGSKLRNRHSEHRIFLNSRDAILVASL